MTAPETDTAPQAAAEIDGAARAISPAWLIPLGALAIAGFIAWGQFAGRGPLITLELDSASGLQPGKTPLRHRDVQIGVVETLGFDDGFGKVEAKLRISAEAAAHLGPDSRFWIVAPQISAAGITGLETLLSGAYLETDLAGAPGAAAARYQVLPEPPQTPAGAPGARITLVDREGGALSVGAPVYFHSIEVGRIEQRRLGPDGGRIEYDAFIAAPYDGWLGAGARFWNASGLSVTLGAEGVVLRMEALATVLRGGVAFDVIGEGGGGAPKRFKLFSTEKQARDSVFTDDPEASVRFTARFGGSVRGLSPGAPVEYRGVQIGEVEDLTVRAGESASDTHIVVILRMEPARIGFKSDDPGAALAFFARSVGDGLRARLASGNLVTGALYVELVELENAAEDAIDLSGEPYPQLPSVPSEFDALRASLEQLLTRAGDLPIEGIMDKLLGALANIEALTGGEAAQTAPEELTAMLRAAREAIRDLNTATLGARAEAAAGSVANAASAVETAAARLPDIARRLEAAVRAAQAMLNAYGPGSPISGDIQSTLRDVREAARAVESLSKALERRPNSIILGR